MSRRGWRRFRYESQRQVLALGLHVSTRCLLLSLAGTWQIAVAGVPFRLHAVYLVHAWFTSVRGSCGRHCFFSGSFNSAYLQCLGLPHHAEYALTSDGSVQWYAS